MRIDLRFTLAQLPALATSAVLFQPAVGCEPLLDLRSASRMMLVRVEDHRTKREIWGDLEGSMAADFKRKRSLGKGKRPDGRGGGSADPRIRSDAGYGHSRPARGRASMANH